MLASVLSSPWLQGLSFVVLSSFFALLIAKYVGPRDGGTKNSIGDIYANNVHVEQRSTEINNTTRVEHHHHHPPRSTRGSESVDDDGRLILVGLGGLILIGILAAYRVKLDHSLPFILVIAGGISFGTTTGATFASNRIRRLRGARLASHVAAVIASLSPLALCLVFRHPYLSREMGEFALGLVRLGWVQSIWDLDSSARTFLAGQALAVFGVLVAGAFSVVVAVGDAFRVATDSGTIRRTRLTKWISNDIAAAHSVFVLGILGFLVAGSIVVAVGGFNAFVDRSTTQLDQIAGPAEPDPWNSRMAIRAEATKRFVTVEIFSARHSSARIRVTRSGKQIAKSSGLEVSASELKRVAVRTRSGSCREKCRVSVRLIDAEGGQAAQAVAASSRPR